MGAMNNPEWRTAGGSRRPEARGGRQEKVPNSTLQVPRGCTKVTIITIISLSDFQFLDGIRRICNVIFFGRRQGLKCCGGKRIWRQAGCLSYGSSNVRIMLKPVMRFPILHA